MTLCERMEVHAPLHVCCLGLCRLCVRAQPCWTCAILKRIYVNCYARHWTCVYAQRAPYIAQALRGMADAMQQRLNKMRAAGAAAPAHASFYMYTSGENTMTLPGNEGTASRAHNLTHLTQLSDRLKEVTGMAMVNVTDTSIDLVNKPYGPSFECFLVTVNAAESHLLKQDRFQVQDRNEYFHSVRVTGLRDTVQEQGKTVQVQAASATLELSWCDATLAVLSLTRLFVAKGWRIGPADGLTRTVVFVLPKGMVTPITETYAELTAEDVCAQFRAHGQVTAEVCQIMDTTKPGQYELCLKHNGKMHSTVPAQGEIWDGLAFEGDRYGKVVADYRIQKLGDYHRWVYTYGKNLQYVRCDFDLRRYISVTCIL